MFNDHILNQRLKEWDEPPYMPVIKVMGMGGGGSNAVDRMIHFGLSGVDFIIANTDAQAMSFSQAMAFLRAAIAAVSSSSRSVWKIGVSTTHGQSTDTEIPSLARSLRRTSEKPTTAYLLVQ